MNEGDDDTLLDIVGVSVEVGEAVGDTLVDRVSVCEGVGEGVVVMEEEKLWENEETEDDKEDDKDEMVAVKVEAVVDGDSVGESE